nr:unnamed protein product [Digitaria exilis]
MMHGSFSHPFRFFAAWLAPPLPIHGPRRPPPGGPAAQFGSGRQAAAVIGAAKRAGTGNAVIRCLRICGHASARLTTRGTQRAARRRRFILRLRAAVLSSLHSLTRHTQANLARDTGP